MAYYRKRPVTIEAWLWEPNDPELAGSVIGAFAAYAVDYSMGPEKELYVKTLEGTMMALPGDYIIKGVRDEFYPCAPEIFEETYELVSE